MGFGKIVGQVVWSRFPNQLEMILINSILDPMVPHVNCFAAFDFCGAVGNSSSWHIVVDDLFWALGVAEVA